MKYAMESARLLGISGFAVGFVILSVSTGLPEAVTAIMSVLADAPTLSTGNIFGSNVVNITLVLGLTVLLTGKMDVEPRTEKSLLNIMLLIGLIVGAMMFLPQIGLAGGIMLCVLYIAVVYGMRNSPVMKEIVGQEESEADEDIRNETIRSNYLIFLKLLISLLFVLVSAELIVRSSTQMAEQLGLSNQVIGATIVAIGTGLPELSLELKAAKKKEYGLALGNIFGSILVNFTLVLGILAAVSTAPLALSSLLPIQFAFMASVGIVYVFMHTQHEVNLREASVLLVVFAVYLFNQAGVV